MASAQLTGSPPPDGESYDDGNEYYTDDGDDDDPNVTYDDGSEDDGAESDHLPHVLVGLTGSVASIKADKIVEVSS